MMEKEWVKSLKVGDVVAVVTRAYSEIRRVDQSTVKRITPSGRIVVRSGNEDYQYRPDGTRMGEETGWHTYLSPLTPKLVEWKERQVALAGINQVNFRELPVEKLKKILDVIKED